MSATRGSRRLFDPLTFSRRAHIGWLSLLPPAASPPPPTPRPRPRPLPLRSLSAPSAAHQDHRGHGSGSTHRCTGVSAQPTVVEHSEAALPHELAASVCDALLTASAPDTWCGRANVARKTVARVKVGQTVPKQLTSLPNASSGADPTLGPTNASRNGHGGIALGGPWEIPARPQELAIIPPLYLQLHRFLCARSDVASALASRVPNLRCFMRRAKTGGCMSESRHMGCRGCNKNGGRSHAAVHGGLSHQSHLRRHG